MDLTNTGYELLAYNTLQIKNTKKKKNDEVLQLQQPL
jgi:hypothetical protein